MFICGMGRNDGVHRLYFVENFDILTEYTYSGSSWAKSSETTTNGETALNAVVVGPGRGDGINRVYVLQFVGYLFEFTFKN